MNRSIIESPLQYQVWREFSQQAEHYVTSKLRIYHVQAKRYRIIWYIHYSDWSEQNIPRSVAPFLGELMCYLGTFTRAGRGTCWNFIFEFICRLLRGAELSADGLGGGDPARPQYQPPGADSLQWQWRRTIWGHTGRRFVALHVGPQSGR